MATSDLLAVPRLDPAQRAAVAALQRDSEAHDGCEHPLELDQDRVPAGGEVGHFLAWRDGRLVAYLGVDPQEPAEAVVVVAPDARRCGIGRRLVDAACVEVRCRGGDQLVLTVPGISSAGHAFVAALGAEHDYSEYRMELDRSLLPPPEPSDAGFSLCQVGNEAVETLIRISCAAFDLDPARQRARFAEWLSRPGQRLFIGYEDGVAAGCVRVGVYDGVTYLHTFAVLPERQGRGLGGRILRTMADLLVAEGGGPIRLEVDVENPRALSLYERSGFRTLDSFQYHRLGV